MMNHIFSQGDLTKIFPDVSRKTFFVWAKDGLFEWIAEKSDARGVHKEYSLWNLYQIGIVRELAALNVPLLMIRIIMDRYFKDHLQEGSVIEKPLEELHVKASESDRMSKYLILFKDNKRRDWKWFEMVGNFHLLDIPTIKTLVELNQDFSAVTILFLPVIISYVQFCIKEADLS